MKTKVLIIKHDTKAATELRQQLAKNKDICVCDIISDGGNAVSAIRAQNPNVILLDFLLPNLDGLAVMEEVNGWGTRGYRFLLQGNASQIRFAQNTCRGNVDHIFVRFIDKTDENMINISPACILCKSNLAGIPLQQEAVSTGSPSVDLFHHCQSIQIRQQEIQQNDIWILCANCRNCVSAV